MEAGLSRGYPAIDVVPTDVLKTNKLQLAGFLEVSLPGFVNPKRFGAVASVMLYKLSSAAVTATLA